MKRLPVIRHIRWLRHRIGVNRHYAFYSALGYFPVHRAHDEAILDSIWRGEA